VLTKLTFGGAIYVSAVCVLPSILIKFLSTCLSISAGRLSFDRGGRGLDTAGQIETHLLTRSTRVS
jgi:preprotein translocase subunit SecY